MLSIGFDPSFVDTLVRVENKDKSLANNLPLPGHHHRTPAINRIAGGNGVNISAILTAIEIEHTLVVPCDEEFQILLNKRRIELVEKIDCEVNNSVGITWLAGEMQFNDARHGPSKRNWTESIHNLWIESPLQCYLNWGLNPNSLEWVSILWLASCGWKYQEIIDERNLFEKAINSDTPVKSILLEPGSIKFHDEKNKLMQLLHHIANKSNELEYAIFSSNEEEHLEYSDIQMKQYILHTSENVSLKIGEDIKRYEVPRLSKEPLTFVGAGDAFIAGIIHSILGKQLDPEVGINTAQEFLHGNLY
ncbi:MAG: hypothetical protein GPJ54_00305 [Candidatus Heimdallarchaeota archaeon]|nr:hypothetical protein [Candidatus Heimdallarchaeota archaeon]